MEYSEQDFLDLCKTQIEKKFHLGNGLKQRDFEYLIDLIEEASGTRLSLSTLKRLWREESGQNPHPATLDALAAILECRDWLDFKVQNAQSVDPAKSFTGSDPHHSRNTNSKQKKPSLIAAATLAAVAMAALIIFAFTSQKSKTGNMPNAREVQFSLSNTVSAGVPNTVIFRYDVSGVEADSFFIQRDWDPNNIAEIDPASGHFTSVYYLPGFHKARLIADGTVLKTEEIFIQTEGWLPAGFYSDKEDPIYIPSLKPENGVASIRKEDLIEQRADIDRLRGTLLFNIREFGGLDGHNFRCETRFRLGELGNNPCAGMQFTIHTEANIYFVQLAPMGCVGMLKLLIGERFMSGSDHDLSAFGTEVYEWQELSLTVSDKYATVLLNGKNIFETDFKNDFGKIVGVDYRFEGLGSVDYLRFSDPDGNLVYEDTFDEQVPAAFTDRNE